MNHSLYDSITPHYPAVQASNYDQYHYSSEPRFWAGHLSSYQGQSHHLLLESIWFGLELVRTTKTSQSRS